MALLWHYSDNTLTLLWYYYDITLTSHPTLPLCCALYSTSKKFWAARVCKNLLPLSLYSDFYSLSSSRSFLRQNFWACTEFSFFYQVPQNRPKKFWVLVKCSSTYPLNWKISLNFKGSKDKTYRKKSKICRKFYYINT